MDKFEYQQLPPFAFSFKVIEKQRSWFKFVYAKYFIQNKHTRDGDTSMMWTCGHGDLGYRDLRIKDDEYNDPQKLKQCSLILKLKSNEFSDPRIKMAMGTQLIWLPQKIKWRWVPIGSAALEN